MTTCKHLLQGAPECVFCTRDQMLQTLREILEELQLDDSRHDLQAKIFGTPGFSQHPTGEP